MPVNKIQDRSVSRKAQTYKAQKGATGRDIAAVATTADETTITKTDGVYSVKNGGIDTEKISPAARPFKAAVTVTTNGQNMFLLPADIAALLASDAAKTDSSLKVCNAEYDYNTDYIFIQDGSDLYLKWISTKFTLKTIDKVELRR